MVSGFFAACSPDVGVDASSDERLSTWVTVQPQRFIVERVAGDLVTVEVMVRAGQSPESYAPTVPQMARLAKADLYFGIGMPLENTILAKIERSMPSVTFIQSADILELDSDHVHGPHCLHGDEDPHRWVDPIWMATHVDQVRDALSQARPGLAATFAANADQLKGELLALDAEIADLLEPYQGRSFYINHPSLGHYSERYGIVQRSIEQAGSAPSARQIAGLVEQLKMERVGAIFSQPEFGRSSADVLARALDVEVVEVDVLSAEYLANLLDITKHLVDSFQE